MVFNPESIFARLWICPFNFGLFGDTADSGPPAVPLEFVIVVGAMLAKVASDFADALVKPKSLTEGRVDSTLDVNIVLVLFVSVLVVEMDLVATLVFGVLEWKERNVVEGA